MAGKFEIDARDGEFRFNLKAGNGQVILGSERYSSLVACQTGVESVRVHAGNEVNFHSRTAKDGSPYFALIAGNGQTIGCSQMYASAGARDDGIRAVMSNAPDAEVIDPRDAAA